MDGNKIPLANSFHLIVGVFLPLNLYSQEKNRKSNDHFRLEKLIINLILNIRVQSETIE